MDSAAADGPHPGPGPAANPLGHGPVLLLTGARLADGRVVDVRISGDRIQAVGTAGGLGPLPAVPGGPTVTTGARIDLRGYLLLPAPAEAHAHYDVAFSAALPTPPPETPAELTRRVTEAALTSLGYGATAQRTHVRIGDVHGLRRLEAVLTSRQALRGLADLRAVAMPRLLTGRAGADGRAQLREALKLGATAAGGCPELDPDPAGYVQLLLEAAREADCPVDLHTTAADPVQLARLAGALAPLRPRVVVGPCGSLAPGAATVLANSGVRVVCLPQNGGCSGLEGLASGLRPAQLRDLLKARCRWRPAAARCATGPTRSGGRTRWRPRTCWRRPGCWTPTRRTTRSRTRRGWRSGCRRCGWTPDSRRSCWRCAGTACPGRWRAGTAGWWCTAGGSSAGPARYGSSPTRWPWRCPGSRTARTGAEPGRTAPGGTGTDGYPPDGRSGRAMPASRAPPPPGWPPERRSGPRHPPRSGAAPSPPTLCPRTAAPAALDALLAPGRPLLTGR